jgi:hypothetical protein
MRPNGVESLGALRAALAEVLAPELTSAFAQDTASTVQMLIESLAAEWDTAAENLRADNGTLAPLLGEARDALRARAGNDEIASAVKEIDEALAATDDGSIAISALSSRNRMLRSALEKTLVAIEGCVDEREAGELTAVRAAAYAHLREVAGRGWSFWDVASFREYMARYRTAQSQVTA